jgi:histidinol-phosphate/aromatic aminotransferase/cobyric acid decarboxylase-like protein
MSSTFIKEAVADSLGIEAEKLLMTNGSAEAFSLIAGVMLTPGKSTFILNPCYSDYEHVSRLNGANVIVHQLDAGNGFRIKPDVLLGEIRSSEPELIWLCSPNNPTGVIIEPELIGCIADVAAGYGGFVVVDEAYAAFSLKGSLDVKKSEHGNILTVRSMTKDYGIPGLRLGFIHAEADLIHILDLYKPCWSVSVPAQAVGRAVLDETEYYTACWTRIESLRNELIAGMCECGIEPSKASANDCGIFIFFKTPEVGGSDSFIVRMKKNGIIIRNCESMGAPGFCRIGVKLSDDNETFLTVLRMVING